MDPKAVAPNALLAPPKAEALNALLVPDPPNTEVPPNGLLVAPPMNAGVPKALGALPDAGKADVAD